jgi:hypothetical protein
VTRFFLLLVTVISLPACSDRFTPAPPPDLRKDPYDFSVVVPPYTGPGADMVTGNGGGGGAGGGMVSHDLSVPHDLALPPSD